MSQPLVSVIVPAYNRERYLGEALDSIVNQGYHPLEIIVADDGSSDGTARVARAYPEVRLLSLAHGGPAAARNAAIAVSRGALLAFLDSDDYWTPGKLDAQVQLLQRNPHLGCCFTRMWHFLEPGHTRPAWAEPVELARHAHLLSICSMLARREVFDQVGDFDIRLTWGEDTDWLFRAQVARIPCATLPEVFVHRRIHDTNLTTSSGPPLPIAMRIAKAHIDRTRLKWAGIRMSSTSMNRPVSQG